MERSHRVYPPSPGKKLNIIKSLSYKKFNCNPHTLISITQSIIASKIEYGLFLYGYCAKSHLNKIKTIYNAALRKALNAYRTTPINHLLFEAKMQTIESLRYQSTIKLYKPTLFCKDTPLYKILRIPKIAKKTPSCIERSAALCNEINIPHKPIPPYPSFPPPWLFQPSSVVSSLRTHKKAHTPPEIFRARFLELKNDLSDYSFIYTDGSKEGDNVGFSVTSESETISSFLLPTYSSIFTAEIIAILIALQYTKKFNKKFAICTDSLSSIDAILNINNQTYYPSLIRNLLYLQSPNIKLIWVPGHVQIAGNEFADKIAKDTLRSPSFLSPNFNPQDLNKLIKKLANSNQLLLWDKTSEWYRAINKNKLSVKDYANNIEPSRMSRIEVTKIIRLRLGHSKLTHEHYINKNISSQCTYCNQAQISIHHILSECSSFHTQRHRSLSQNNPKELLSNPNPKNIKTIIHFLKISNLYNLI